jgi:hypothetical protein
MNNDDAAPNTDRSKDGRFVKGCRPSDYRPTGRPFHGTSDPRPGSRGFWQQSPEAILRRKGKAITRKCIELALAGDVMMLRLCLERLIAPMTASMANFEDRIALLEAAREKGLH